MKIKSISYISSKASSNFLAVIFDERMMRRIFPL
jgi:hypothetical protein